MKGLPGDRCAREGVCATHIYVAAVEARLLELDESLARVRGAIQRPEYRRRLLRGIDVPGGVTTVRLLHAIAVLSETQAPSIGEVATRLAVEPSTASRSIDAVARSGLISKHSCARDSRRARLVLTAQGQAVLEEAVARRRELLSQVTDGWTAAEINRLVELLDRLCQGFDALETSA